MSKKRIDGGRPIDPALRVGALVDLQWTPSAGGHVKTWERIAAAAVALGPSLDLTVHFSGAAEATHVIAPHVRYRIHRPLLSTARVPFLSHVPDHSDLAPYHPRLAAALGDYDVIHTTDGVFAFARTAARVARRQGIPLVSSIHTTEPYYARVFTKATIERFAGDGRVAHLLTDRLNLAGRAEARMQRRLDDHLRECARVLASSAEDQLRLVGLLGRERVGRLRRGIDHGLFDPRKRDRAWLEREMGIPRDGTVIISVGRLDRVKNVLTLAHAVRLLVDRGQPVYLLCPGKGADRTALVALLGSRVICPGVLEPKMLARAYASADLAAQPAIVEELSNAVLEASSSGLPLLVAASSGSGRFVVQGETGFIVPDAEPASWASALNALLDNRPRLRAMGHAARAWSMRHVPTWHEVLVEDLLPVWRELAFPSKHGHGQSANDSRQSLRELGAR